MELTIEFECDNDEQAKEFLAELRSKYPLYPQANSGIRINGWASEPIQEKEKSNGNL